MSSWGGGGTDEYSEEQCPRSPLYNCGNAHPIYFSFVTLKMILLSVRTVNCNEWCGISQCCGQYNRSSCIGQSRFSLTESYN